MAFIVKETQIINFTNRLASPRHFVQPYATTNISGSL